MTVRTRFAPSPTGNPHIGNMRTALFEYLYAKSNHGEFLLRIEDTDQKRFVPESSAMIFETLRWLGITNDEEPVHQSQRLPIYHEYAQKLIASGHAYYCFCTETELHTMREKQQADGKAPRYDGTCLHRSAEDIHQRLSNKDPHIIRMKIPKGRSISWKDMVKGDICMQSDEIDDQVLMKSDGFPTYHLAVVVDDYLMRITHVIRGEDWIPSTPKHILLYEAFGWPLPQFAHLPMILGNDRGKLSKRHGAVGALTFREQGYLPEAVVNYLALLGWNPKTDQEIFTLQELESRFHISQVQTSAAIFDYEKLRWINAQHIRRLSHEQYLSMAQPFIPADLWNERLVLLEKERIHQFSELPALLAEYQQDFSPELGIWKKLKTDDQRIEKTRISLINSLAVIESIQESHFTIHTLESHIKQEIETHQWGVGETLWPLRVALARKEHSPSPFELMEAFGKKETIKRIHNALEKLQKA